MFSTEQKKELTLEFKVRAKIEELKTEAIKKEIQENKNNYSPKELEIFNNLLQESIKDYNNYQDTYLKGSIIFGIENLTKKYGNIQD